MTRVIPAVVVLLCLAPTRGYPQDENGPRVHQRTGLVFPPATAHLSLSRVRALSSDRRDAAFTYQGSGPNPLTVTVFVYAKAEPASRPDEPLAEHAERVRGQVLDRHPGGECTPWLEGVPGLTNASQEACWLEAQIGGSTQKLRSLIVLVDLGSFWLKYRATAPAMQRDEIEAAVRSLGDEVKVPGPPPNEQLQLTMREGAIRAVSVFIESRFAAELQCYATF